MKNIRNMLVMNQPHRIAKKKHITEHMAFVEEMS